MWFQAPEQDGRHAHIWQKVFFFFFFFSEKALAESWRLASGNIASGTRGLLNIKVREKSKVQQTAALPRHREEEETDKTKQAQTNNRSKSIKISSLFPKRDNRSRHAHTW